VHFCLVDRVLECGEDRIVTLKQVSAAEDYLQDHFPTYPVLPGVFMLEAMVQAARELASRRGRGDRLVLGSVRALKYGRFVRPGGSLRVEVRLTGEHDGVMEFAGQAVLVEPAEAGGGGPAAGGKFTLRPLNRAG
jgi:3-hydroxyacyl-[acyl-carrier-protein] dehydratase